MAIAQEAAFGTAISAQGSFYELDILSPVQPDFASGVVEDSRKRSDGKRVMSPGDTYRATTGGMYVIPFECIATRNTVDLLLAAAMQDKTSTTLTSEVYYNIFEFDSGTTAPDFSADAGIFLTVLGSDPSDDASNGNWVAKSCVVRNLTLSASPGTNGGRLTASGEFVTGFDIDETAVTATPASWVAVDTYYFPFQLYTTCSVGGADLVPYSFSITLANGAVRVGHSAGEAQTYHMPLFEANIELVAKLDANTVGMVADYRVDPSPGAAEVEVIMAWGSIDATGSLNFTMNGIFTAPPNRDFGAESGVGVTLAFQGVDDGTNEALVASFSNKIDRSWTA